MHTSPAAARRQFLAGMASQVGLPPEILAVPGVSVASTAERADTGIAACYRVDERLVIWTDPAVLDRVRQLDSNGRGVVPDAQALGAALEALGLVWQWDIEILLLGAPTVSAEASSPPLVVRGLDELDPARDRVVRDFVASCDPVDAEQAGLEYLGDAEAELAEQAVSIVVDTSPDGPTAGQVVALASAIDWAWDPAFADIAVVVHPSWRQRGVARLAVAATTRELREQGRLPLYRHDQSNIASAKVAAAVGFVGVASASGFRLADSGAPA
jgi:GNAT superfamily N-acetyltransferase